MDPANIEDESPNKKLINQVDIPSLAGSVKEGEEIERANSEVRDHATNDLAEIDQPDKFTNIDGARDGMEEDEEQDPDAFTEVQEFVNEAPDLGLGDGDDDGGMVGFDDFVEDVKPTPNDLGADFFNDFA